MVWAASCSCVNGIMHHATPWVVVSTHTRYVPTYEVLLSWSKFKCLSTCRECGGAKGFLTYLKVLYAAGFVFSSEVAKGSIFVVFMCSSSSSSSSIVVG